MESVILDVDFYHIDYNGGSLKQIRTFQYLFSFISVFFCNFATAYASKVSSCKKSIANVLSLKIRQINEGGLSIIASLVVYATGSRLGISSGVRNMFIKTVPSKVFGDTSKITI